LKVAFVGKGGAGKSAISGTFARLLARQGTAVLAVDSDPLPGLAWSLGLAIDDSPPIPDDAVVERQEGEKGPRYRLRPDLDPSEAVELYSVEAPDGVRFLQFGKVKAGQVQQLFRAQLAFLQIVRELPDDKWTVVGDLPGGTRQAFTGWGNFAQTVLIVVEPMAKSLLSARRLARMAEMEHGPQRVVAVASKVREHGDETMIERRTGLEVVASVPYDEAFADAERKGMAPIDDAPESPAVRAVESLVKFVSESTEPTESMTKEAEA
jgi:CO dehydrogenase maturation factor